MELTLDYVLFTIYIYIYTYIVFLLIVQLIPLHNIAAFINICRFFESMLLNYAYPGRSNFDKGRHNLTTLIKKIDIY